MIYVFHGTDIQKNRTKVRDLVVSLLKKKPDALHMRITQDEWSDNTLAETIGSQGLFSDKLIVQFDNLLATDSKEISETIIDSVEDIKKSDNIFIFLEEEIKAAILKKLEKHAEKVVVHDEVVRTEAPQNFFGLADAFGRRDKKTAWIEFQKAKKVAKAGEEVHGMLFWQLKSMLIASKTGSVASGLKPFVYNKSKQFAGNFKDGELEQLSRKMISIYHDAHRGLVDINDGLEMFLLEL